MSKNNKIKEVLDFINSKFPDTPIILFLETNVLTNLSDDSRDQMLLNFIATNKDDTIENFHKIKKP